MAHRGCRRGRSYKDSMSCAEVRLQFQRMNESGLWGWEGGGGPGQLQLQENGQTC